MTELGKEMREWEEVREKLEKKMQLLAQRL